MRPIWFGGTDRSEASMDEFFAWLGPKKCRRIQLAVMDMWKPFRNSTKRHAPQANILFDKFHIMRHLVEQAKRAKNTEAAVNLGISTKRLLSAIEEAEKLQPRSEERRVGKEC